MTGSWLLTCSLGVGEESTPIRKTVFGAALLTYIASAIVYGMNLETMFPDTHPELLWGVFLLNKLLVLLACSAYIWNYEDLSLRAFNSVFQDLSSKLSAENDVGPPGPSSALLSDPLCIVWWAPIFLSIQIILSCALVILILVNESIIETESALYDVMLGYMTLFTFAILFGVSYIHTRTTFFLHASLELVGATVAKNSGNQAPDGGFQCVCQYRELLERFNTSSGRAVTAPLMVLTCIAVTALSRQLPSSNFEIPYVVLCLLLMIMFFFTSACVTFKGKRLIENAVMSSSKIVDRISLLNFAARIFGVDVTFGLLGQVAYFLLLVMVFICDVDLLAQFFY
jgi:hypothetical protein